MSQGLAVLCKTILRLEGSRRTVGHSLFHDVLKDHIHIVIKASQRPDKFLVSTHYDP